MSPPVDDKVAAIRAVLEQPGNGGRALDAVDLVLKIHVPQTVSNGFTLCHNCTGHLWPCTTIEAIYLAVAA